MSDRPSVLHLLLYLAIAGAGVYLLAKPGELTRAQTAGAVGLIVVGVLLVLLALLLRATKTEAEAAAEIDQLDRTLYAQGHERRLVNESTIRDYSADLDFYRTRTAELKALGFHHVGDYVDVTAERASGSIRAVIRCFIGDGGTTMGAVFDVRVRRLARLLQVIGIVSKDMRCVELETEFSDGSFACTTTAVEAAKVSEFPGISRVFMPTATATIDLFEAHHAHLRRRLDGSPGIQPVRISSFQELIASQERMTALKGSFRMSSQFDIAAEMEKISGRPLSEAEQRVADEITERREREHFQRGGDT